MIAKVRKYIVSVVEEGRLKGSVIEESDLSVEEMILAICLMSYYLINKKDIYKEILELFRNRIESVNETVLDRAKNSLVDEETVEQLLTVEFQEQLNQYVKFSNSEFEMKTAAQKLHDYFFGGVDEADIEATDDTD